MSGTDFRDSRREEWNGWNSARSGSCVVSVYKQ